MVAKNVDVDVFICEARNLKHCWLLDLFFLLKGRCGLIKYIKSIR